MYLLILFFYHILNLIMVPTILKIKLKRKKNSMKRFLFYIVQIFNMWPPGGRASAMLIFISSMSWQRQSTFVTLSNFFLSSSTVVTCRRVVTLASMTFQLVGSSQTSQILNTACVCRCNTKHQSKSLFSQIWTLFTY